MWTYVLKNLPVIFGVLAVVGGLGFAGYKAYDFGVDYGKATTKAEYEAIISDINKKSAEALKKEQDEHNRWVEAQDKLVNDLRANNNKLNDIIKENELEADKDPNAKRPALGASSVMRLNRIR